MATGVFALLGLCLVFSAYGIPIGKKVSPPKFDLRHIKPAHKGVNPQLLGGGVEGDMIFPKNFNPKSQTRGTAKFGNVKWPDNTIPVDISAITNPDDQMAIILSMAFLVYFVGTPLPDTEEREPCIMFRDREINDTVYLNIQYGQGCSATVGYMTNMQPQMTLQQDGCFSLQTIQHELIHVLGFFHEQSRPDRDDFIDVHLENVEPSMQHNFNKFIWGWTAYNQGTPYDYQSIMHYGRTAFSTNGQPTMIPRQDGVEIGVYEFLSPIDIAEIRELYSCTP